MGEMILGLCPQKTGFVHYDKPDAAGNTEKQIPDQGTLQIIGAKPQLRKTVLPGQTKPNQRGQGAETGKKTVLKGDKFQPEKNNWRMAKKEQQKK